MKTRWLWFGVLITLAIYPELFGQGEIPDIVIGNKEDLEEFELATFLQKGVISLLAYIIAPTGGCFTIYEGFVQYKAALKTNGDKHTAYLMMVVGCIMICMIKIIPEIVEWLKEGV